MRQFRGSTMGENPRFLNLSTRPSRSVEGGRGKAIDGPGSHVKEIEDGKTYKNRIPVGSPAGVLA